MKSIEVGKVKIHLQRTTRGFSVSVGTWTEVDFVTYDDASAWFEKFCPEVL